MDLEVYYKKYNYPSPSKFLSLLKGDGIKVTKKEIDEFLNPKTEQQQVKVIKKSRKNLGKIVSFFPMSLLQMDILDLAKYYKTNHGYKYILCIVDVFSRKAFTYPMKNKDNNSVFEAFEKFIKESNIKKYSEMSIFMSDHDSTFTTSEFKDILDKNDFIQELNILNDPKF
mmetsp:Transcript_86045/g.229628  ORF Transcript_86045/g.229628 Transcript_86045/m.229628 type:complete len:170 (+) Transcript_86045:287-796(+)